MSRSSRVVHRGDQPGRRARRPAAGDAPRRADAVPDRAPEVGGAAENPALNQPGVVLTGFVERVGDPVPLVAEDGSSHLGERVLVEALDALATLWAAASPSPLRCPRTGDPRRSAHYAGRCGTSRTCHRAAVPAR